MYWEHDWELDCGKWEHERRGANRALARIWRDDLMAATRYAV
jgi:hypothetical protein